MYVYAHMYRGIDVCMYVCMYAEMYVCRHVWMYVCRYACVYLCRYEYKDICVQMYMVCTCVYASMHMFGANKRERGERHPDVVVLCAGGRQAACLEVLSNCPSVSCSPATELAHPAPTM